MKLMYTVQELQAVEPTSKNYGKVLQVLARLGSLEVSPSPEKKAKLEKEVTELLSTIYLPKVGDLLSFENYKTGIRYKCLVTRIGEDGWLFGEPEAFNERYWFLLDVLRNNKTIYRW